MLQKGAWVLTALCCALSVPLDCPTTAAIEGPLGPFVLGADPRAPASLKGM